MMETALEGLDAQTVERTLRQLDTVKDNLRRAISRSSTQQQAANG
jgi:hypothetical protein